jgi:hypothetical protein
MPGAPTSKNPTGAAPAAIAPGSVKVTRILVGADAQRAGVLDESLVREHADSDRYLVYFGLALDQAGGAGQRLTYTDFRLEDASGLIYSPLRPRDALNGQATSGGVAFAVYNDSAPARLLVRVGGERFAPLPDSVFRRKGR